MAFIEFFIDVTRRASLAIAVMTSFAISLPASANADPGSFLKSLEGEWRGSGLYRFEGRQTDERISCRVTNTYDAAAQRLDLSGDCATAQIKNSVKGYLKEDGDEVSGALLGTLDGSRMTKSTGSVKGNQLVVLANFVDNATGTLYRSQQVVRRTGKGFEADFYWYDNRLGKFAKTGSIKFTSR
jgi:hypothetical protein